MKSLGSNLVMLTFLIATVAGVAQVEVQVPFDERGNILVITKDINDRLAIFDAPSSFNEARLYRLTDTTFVLEVSRVVGANIERERKQLTISDVKALRIRVQGAVPLDDKTFLDQSGRSSLLWGSTLWSLFYYGSAASYAFGSSDEFEPSAATYLITGGVGFLLPALLTNNANVTQGAASLALGGMFQGAIHGWLIGGLVAGEDLSPKTGFSISMVTGITETVVGYVVGSNLGIKEGKAGVINTTEFYTMVCGGLLGLTIIGPEEFGNQVGLRLSSGLALAGAAGGIILGNAIGNAQYFSSTDATVYGTSGLLGLTLPYAILTAVLDGSIDGRLVSGMGIVGVAGGLLIGNELVKGLNYRGEDGTGVVLGTLAGALVGVGVGVLASDARVGAVAAWVGAAAGFATGLAMAKPEIEGRSSGQLKFDFNPLGLALGAHSKVPVPVGSLTYRF
ncbi:MAG: hypothetical protein NTX15_10120 [Candidatus Kapabacteria bacterium]|nr:hypothetical protein [Candidatus Kapabacteria bacterium]